MRLMRLKAHMQKLFASDTGTVAITAALLIPVMIGGLGICIDVPYWRYRNAVLQNAADMTAMSLARDINNSITNAIILTVNARNEAKKNGCNVSCSVSVSYPYNANTKSVSVSLTDSSTTRFFSFIYDTSQKVLSVKSAATIGSSAIYGGNGCLLALSTTNAATGSISLKGNASIPATTCESYSNGTSTYSAATLGGSATVGGTLSAVGGISITGSSSVATSKPNQAPTVDPYLGLIVKGGVADSGACKDSAAIVNWQSLTWNISPGHWCRGWNVSNGAVLNLSPGVYYIGNNDQGYQGVFDISLNSQINATGGVTIVLIDIDTSLLNPVNITGNSSVNIVAPTSGTTSGISLMSNTDSLIYVRDVNMNHFSVGGGGNINYTGAVYLPNSIVALGGGTGAYNASNPCTQLIVAQISLTGGAQTMGNQCVGTGVKAFGTPSMWTTGGVAGTTLRITE